MTAKNKTVKYIPVPEEKDETLLLILVAKQTRILPNSEDVLWVRIGAGEVTQVDTLLNWDLLYA